MGPIVMLRGPKGRYCQFVGITVSSAQKCRDAYCIWPRMMPRAELGININLSCAGIDKYLSTRNIDAQELTITILRPPKHHNWADISILTISQDAPARARWVPKVNRGKATNPRLIQVGQGSGKTLGYR